MTSEFPMVMMMMTRRHFHPKGRRFGNLDEHEFSYYQLGGIGDIEQAQVAFIFELYKTTVQECTCMCRHSSKEEKCKWFGELASWKSCDKDKAGNNICWNMTASQGKTSHYPACSASCTWFYLQDSLHINRWEQDEGSASILDYQASMLCLLIQSLRIVGAFVWLDVSCS